MTRLIVRRSRSKTLRLVCYLFIPQCYYGKRVVADKGLDVELKAKIQAFKDEKKREKAARVAAASNPDTLDTDAPPPPPPAVDVSPDGMDTAE
jgi:hypothetical protein